jgi:uncharacterized repeat protein (TIGR03943 family)
VRPVARPWVLLAGLAIAALGVWSLVASARAQQRDGPADEHGHHGASRAAWLIVAPVVAILVVAPPALGAYSVARIPPAEVVPPSHDFPALHGPDPVHVTLLDYFARATFDHGRTFAGHRVELTGFVLRAEPGGFELARLVITCCAADARPVVVSVQTTTSAPAPNTWLTVIGTYGGVSPSDATVPVLHAGSITPVHQPADPYD